MTHKVNQPSFPEMQTELLASPALSLLNFPHKSARSLVHWGLSDHSLVFDFLLCCAGLVLCLSFWTIFAPSQAQLGIMYCILETKNASTISGRAHGAGVRARLKGRWTHDNPQTFRFNFRGIASQGSMIHVPSNPCPFAAICEHLVRQIAHIGRARAS